MNVGGINQRIKNRAAELALAHSSDVRLISQSPYCNHHHHHHHQDDDVVDANANDDSEDDDDDNGSTFV